MFAIITVAVVEVSAGVYAYFNSMSARFSRLPNGFNNRVNEMGLVTSASMCRVRL